MHADNEDMQRSVQQLKKKCKKLTAELQDTKLHLEGLHSRNHDLEKKQRKSVHLPAFAQTFKKRHSSRPTWQNTVVFYHFDADENAL